ncbi:DUF2507 domain-containing protein [candidate division KSB1 bacterium]|nr:DUF2507 domain-containing protein [candidate division KSB1 bacterium]
MEAKIDVANVLNINRPQLGDEANIALYRLLRLVALEDIIGRGAPGVSYFAGKKLGKSLGMKSLDEFIEFCTNIKIGIIKVPVLQKNKIHVDVYECVTCSGMKPPGRTLCHFEGGLIAGVAETVLNKQVQAKEVTCIGGLGYDSCGFDLEIRQRFTIVF